MARTRSPNYPGISLGVATELIYKVYARDHRNKMSRLTVAKHLGYSSLNGRALSKLGSLRAYGLLEGTSDELRVSDNAVAIIAAPGHSSEYQAAIFEAALRPSLFRELHEYFEGQRPSDENLRFELSKRNFTERAIGNVIGPYLETMELVTRGEQGYYPPTDELKHEETVQTQESRAVEAAASVHAKVGLKVEAAIEREFLHMPLSEDTAVRIIVKGPMTPKELKKLRQLIFIREFWDSLDTGEKSELKQELEELDQKFDKLSGPE